MPLESKTWTIVSKRLNMVVGFMIFENPRYYTNVKLKTLLEYGISYNVFPYKKEDQIGHEYSTLKD